MAEEGQLVAPNNSEAIPETPRKALGGVLGPADTPFDTGDGIRALAYYFAGVELNADMWVTNTYTPDGLRKLGYVGQLPQEAALAAAKSGKAGIIRFLFKRWPERAIKIFNDQERELKDVDLEAKDVFERLINQLMAGQIDREEFRTRVTCVILKTRVEFMNAWKFTDPLIMSEHSGRMTTERANDPSQGGTIRHPGFNIISARASQKTKDHLNL